MKKIIEKRKDIAFYIKLFPLPMHKQAYGEAKSIACGKNPLALLDDAYEKKPLPEGKCKTTVVDDDMKLGKKLGITGTPAIIFPNGTVVPGFRDADSIIKVVDEK
jgi:thiol:disulfide interchange protein DsbC